MEQVFETLETADIDMLTTIHPTMVDTIVNRNFGTTFYHPNGQNQRYHTHKYTGYHHQPIKYPQLRNF